MACEIKITVMAEERDTRTEEQLKPENIPGAAEKIEAREDSHESSMLEESSHQDPEMLVSTDEEAAGKEPVYGEKESVRVPAKTPDDTENIDASAMVAESEKEVTETLVSEDDVTDDDLEKEDDTREVHSDEDHHDEHEEHHEVMPDYGDMSAEKLVAEAGNLLKNEPIQAIKKHFENIRKHLLRHLNEERQQKLEQFLADGGVEIDFEYVQPLRETFRELYGDYKSRRRKHYRELEEELNNNLKTKLELIEKIKELVNKEESIGETFKEFNQIQQEWRNTGPVPRSESGDLYRTYHHHVENFYEYIKINKELRDLDFKKNRQVKEGLIKEAQGLLEREDVPAAFKQLQELHRKWKNTGPVEREKREPLWQTFSEITRQIHDRREDYYGKLREKAGELIERKKQLIEELKGVSLDHDAHHKWQKAMKSVEKIAREFKSIGRLNHPENDAVWDEYRQVLRGFNHAKNQFYKGLKKQHQVNLQKKRELLEIAEKLKDSEDWKEATNEFKRIQAQWKKIGHVPKSESDKIWKQFRGACNHYFDRLTDRNKDRDKALEKNLEAKQALLEELKALELEKGDQKKSVGILKNHIQKWKDAGPVPRSKSKIESEFSKVLDGKFKAIDMDRKESQKIRFENKMDSLSDQGGIKQLYRERDQVSRQIEDTRKELNQLETNMSFFSSSGNNNPLLKEAEKNIKRHREQIELLEEKHKMLNVRIREIKREAEAEGEGESGN